LEIVRVEESSDHRVKFKQFVRIEDLVLIESIHILPQERVECLVLGGIADAHHLEFGIECGPLANEVIHTLLFAHKVESGEGVCGNDASDRVAHTFEFDYS